MKRINPFMMFKGALVPNGIMACKELTQTDKLVWGRLAQFAKEDGRVFPAINKLADEVGVARTAVKDSLRRLREFFLIEVEEVYRNGSQTTNSYFFLDHELFHDCDSCPRKKNDCGRWRKWREKETEGRQETDRGRKTDCLGGRKTDCGPVGKPTTEGTQFKDSEERISSSGQKNRPDGGVEKKKKYHGTDEDHNLAHRIFEAILVVNQTVKEPNWNRWANSIRLMREQDKRSHDEIWHVFDWANRDSFWCSNILSPDKLREKYPQLAPKAGIVRKMRPDARKVRVAADDRKCGACVWLGSGKWFCRAGDGDHERTVAGCDFYRTDEAETLPL